MSMSSLRVESMSHTVFQFLIKASNNSCSPLSRISEPGPPRELLPDLLLNSSIPITIFFNYIYIIRKLGGRVRGNYTQQKICSSSMSDSKKRGVYLQATFLALSIQHPWTLHQTFYPDVHADRKWERGFPHLTDHPWRNPFEDESADCPAGMDGPGSPSGSAMGCKSFVMRSRAAGMMYAASVPNKSRTDKGNTPGITTTWVCWTVRELRLRSKLKHHAVHFVGRSEQGWDPGTQKRKRRRRGRD